MKNSHTWFLTCRKYAGNLLPVSLLLLCGGSTFAQQAEPDAVPASGDAPAITMITASEIPVRAVAISTLVRHATDELAASENVDAVKNKFTAATARLDVLRKETLRRLRRGGPATILLDTEREWLRVEVRLDAWLQTLTSRVDDLGTLVGNVDNERTLWEQTRDDPDIELPAELQKTLGETVDSIVTIEKHLRGARDAVLTLQARIAEQKAEADGMIADLRQETAERRDELFSVDSLPLWQAFSGTQESTDLAGQWATIWNNAYSAIPDYLLEIRTKLLWMLGIFALLLTFIITLGRKARVASIQDNALQSTATLLRRPVAASLLIYLPFLIVIDSRAPALWNSMLGIVLTAAAMRVMPQLLQSSKRNWVIPIGVMFLVWQVVRVAPIAGPIHRLMLLVLAVIAVLTCLLSTREEHTKAAEKPTAWLRTIGFSGRLFAALLVIGVVANVVGSVGLATFVTDGIMYAFFGFIFLFLAVQVLQGVVRITLMTDAANRISIIRSRSNNIQSVLFRLIQSIAMISWVYVVLTGFLIIDPVVTFIEDGLVSEISVGELSLSPKDVLFFVLVIWLSLKLSQFICFVLEAVALPRMHLPRGAPAAILTLTHYAVMVVGVLFALSAAGFDMGRVTIIFGALGVGVGFGLQNVVNNFLSGLILLFERPIKIGDVIEINNDLAVVKHIALRSSTVRTYDGAMLIVPNANLISAVVINWTYGTDKQRVEIPVGVAYGTDPSTVIELLIAIAKKHSDVSDTPEPKAIFLGFGDSSLDFELRVWVPVSTRMTIISDLLVAITAALAEAGIEIPFPQRDLHVRSITGEASLTEHLK